MKQLVDNLDKVQFTTTDKLSICNILAAEIEGEKFVFTVNKYEEIGLVNGSKGWNRWNNGKSVVGFLLKDPRVKIFVFDSLVELADWIKS